MVLEVAPDQPPVCAVILEPQRSIDPEKCYSWPSYLSDLHRKYRCPSYLIVFALGDQAVAVGPGARQPDRDVPAGQRLRALVLALQSCRPPPQWRQPRRIYPAPRLARCCTWAIRTGQRSAYRTLRAVYELHGLDMFV